MMYYNLPQLHEYTGPHPDFWAVGSDWEELRHETVDEALIDWYENEYDGDAKLAVVPDVLTLYGYNRMEISDGDIGDPLCDVIERLHEEYGDSNVNYRELKMPRSEALNKTLIDTIKSEYTPYACEPVCEYTVSGFMIKQIIGSALIERDGNAILQKYINEDTGLMDYNAITVAQTHVGQLCGLLSRRIAVVSEWVGLLDIDPANRSALVHVVRTRIGAAYLAIDSLDIKHMIDAYNNLAQWPLKTQETKVDG